MPAPDRARCPALERVPGKESGAGALMRVLLHCRVP
jgi:hypothetical protein